MKKLLIGLGLVLLSQQSLAISTHAGINFVDVADELGTVVGSYQTNYAPGGSGTEANSLIDTAETSAAATWVYSNDSTATLDLSFSSGALFDISAVDLKILFVGDAGHSGSVILRGGSLDGSNVNFNLGAGAGYTNYNSSTPPPGGSGSPTDFGIFATSLDLVGNLGSGTFTGLSLDISDASAAPALVGVVSTVPVPAAVWLFGSGLLGLVGLARRRA